MRERSIEWAVLMEAFLGGSARRYWATRFSFLFLHNWDTRSFLTVEVDVTLGLS